MWDIIPKIRTELDIDKDENPKIFYTTDSSKRMILSLTNKSINKPFSSITDESELDLTDNSSVEPVDEKAQKSHYILFGKTSEKIIPFSWIKASWRYIETFDCHFGFSIEDAVKYEMITLIGTPDIAIPVSIENEDLILKLIKESNPKVKIERIWVKSSKELGDFFKDRVKNDQNFEGGNVGIYAPKKA